MNNTKGTDAPFPYEGYRVYKVFHRPMGRYMAVLFATNKKRTTRAWARYVYETHHKVRLTPEQTVDHKDEDRLNDEIGNLQVLTRLENTMKNHAANPAAPLVKIKCEHCGTEVERRKGQTNLVPSRAHHRFFCSRSCSGKATVKKSELALAA